MCMAWIALLKSMVLCQNTSHRCLGSARQLVDSAGNITLAKDYQPYGTEKVLLAVA
jgi:hypothetical protein